MEKIGSYRKVDFYVRPATSRGRYIIESSYRGKEIEVETADPEIFDYLDDDSNDEMFTWARKACYNLIVAEYNRIKNGGN